MDATTMAGGTSSAVVIAPANYSSASSFSFTCNLATQFCDLLKTLQELPLSALPINYHVLGLAHGSCSMSRVKSGPARLEETVEIPTVL